MEIRPTLEVACITESRPELRFRPGETQTRPDMEIRPTVQRKVKQLSLRPCELRGPEFPADLT